MPDPFSPATRPVQRADASFKRQINRLVLGYTAWVVGFVLVLGVAEAVGLPGDWIGLLSQLATVAV